MQKQTFKTPGEQNSRVQVANSLNQQPIKITGVLTLQIRPKPSANIDFYGFLRTNKENELHLFNQHSLKECADSKCQNCEIPVIFKIKDPNCDGAHHLWSEK